LLLISHDHRRVLVLAGGCVCAARSVHNVRVETLSIPPGVLAHVQRIREYGNAGSAESTAAAATTTFSLSLSELFPCSSGEKFSFLSLKILPKNE
jgi:hypothetical protein